MDSAELVNRVAALEQQNASLVERLCWLEAVAESAEEIVCSRIRRLDEIVTTFVRSLS